MALIKCPECGAEISDKSNNCIKCGCPISTIDTNLSSASIRPKAKPKKFIIAVICIIIALLVVLIIHKIINNKDIHNKLYWGIPYDKSKNILEDVDIIANDKEKTLLEIQNNFKGYKNVSCSISYNFENNTSLNKISIIIQNDNSNYTDSELIDLIQHDISQSYGDYSKETVGDIVLGYIWETSKTKVKMSYPLDNMITLVYSDINYDIDNTVIDPKDILGIWDATIMYVGDKSATFDSLDGYSIISIDDINGNGFIIDFFGETTSGKMEKSTNNNGELEYTFYAYDYKKRDGFTYKEFATGIFSINDSISNNTDSTLKLLLTLNQVYDNNQKIIIQFEK